MFDGDRGGIQITNVVDRRSMPHDLAVITDLFGARKIMVKDEPPVVFPESQFDWVA
jgi:hypothetical protein